MPLEAFAASALAVDIQTPAETVTLASDRAKLREDLDDQAAALEADRVLGPASEDPAIFRGSELRLLMTMRPTSPAIARTVSAVKRTFADFAPAVTERTIDGVLVEDIGFSSSSSGYFSARFLPPARGRARAVGRKLGGVLML